MSKHELDEIDLKIMNLLGANARISITSISKQIIMSAPAVRERIAKLEDKGIITGYQAKFNWDKLNRGMTTFLLVKTEKCESFVAFCKESQWITEMYRTSGEYNYLVTVQTPSLEELTELQQGIMKFGSSKSFIGIEQLIQK
jgi:DNA-binding Lrp family transcriptional regulator